MRCSRILALVVLIALLFANQAGLSFEVYTQPRQITGVEIPIASPDGRFELFYKQDETSNEMYPDHQIWLASKIRPFETRLLYSYIRDADVSWSPDSTMVAITDFEGSSNSHVVLFRIRPFPEIDQLSEIDGFVEAHEQEMLANHDHFYAKVVGWTLDSASLAIELRGDFTEWDITQTEYTTRRITRQVKFT